jgi:hypothetical protein
MWRNQLRVRASPFTNESADPIGRPVFEVFELSSGNLLLNADGGPCGAGATLTPDVGDDRLSSGEAMTVTFVIGLRQRSPFDRASEATVAARLKDIDAVFNAHGWLSRFRPKPSGSEGVRNARGHPASRQMPKRSWHERRRGVPDAHLSRVARQR